jgi:hypothetical protein
MGIDDYLTAQALTEKISANLPITAYLAKNYIKRSAAQGEILDPKTPYTVEWVGYSGDEGGIMCAIKESIQNNKKLVSSITHLIIDPNHPLAPEIEVYQQTRIMKLALQDRGGFAAELLKPQPKDKQKKRRKGFGNL